MLVNTIDECFRCRLLRKISPDKDKSKKSFEIALQKIERAEKAFNLGLWDYVILESYMAMFHISRAVLYQDGVQEKSHYAIYIYLKEKYGDKIPLNIINLINIHRGERHEVMYGLEYEPTKEDAESALEDAKLFFQNVKNVLGGAKHGK